MPRKVYALTKIPPASDLTTLSKKTVSEADAAIEGRLKGSRKIHALVAFLKTEIEKAYEDEGDVNLTEIIKSNQAEIKKLKKEILTGIADGVIDAGEKVAKRKAGKLRKVMRVFVKKAMPAAVFGFIDNFLMILVGEALDTSLKSVLGISTMAAAGLGNTVSDAVGQMGQQTIDKVLDKVGLGEELEDDEEESRLEKWARKSGGVFGMVIGCLLGLFPLLFTGRIGSIERVEMISDRVCEEERVLLVAGRLL